MAEIDGGEEQPLLAPVIPLFGGARSGPARGAAEGEDDAEGWHSSWVADTGRTARRLTAGDTVTGAAAADSAASRRGRRAPRRDVDDGEGSSSDRPSFSESNRTGDGEVAEKILLRRLRARALSIVEARSALRNAGADIASAEAILEEFVRLGYLDDSALAEQIVRTAIERKGQGRQAIARELAKRSVPREIADECLADLPDDDFERALEYARSKARSLGGRDRETSLRRLVGQLARRGYPSSIALSAARAALDEVG